jgi:rSAM/selenodomain-associated transferase 1
LGALAREHTHAQGGAQRAGALREGVSDVSTTCAIGVMVRAPSAAGKTRLAGDLPASRLAGLRAALLADTLQMAAGLTGVDVVVFVTPATAMSEVAALIGRSFPCTPQSDGDLGDRMRAAFEHLLRERGYGAAMLVGADIPFLSAAHVTEARNSLKASGGIVLGPADDGGYYLVGMTQVHAALFDRIEWGNATVLTDTLRAADRLGIEARLIGSTYDIDTSEDLRRLGRDLAAAPPDAAPNVRRWFGEGQ